MKTIIFHQSASSQSELKASWKFIADSSLANSGKPFFIPDFADEFEACIAPAVKISRLGKSIKREFSYRYFNEIVPAIHFRAPGLLRNLCKAGLPEDPAVSFDRSLITGTPMDFSLFKSCGVFELKKNGETVSVWQLCDHTDYIGIAIEKISVYNTMKTGDLVIPTTSSPCPIAIGDTLRLFCNGNLLLRIDIK